jgi:hypothetical protein
LINEYKKEENLNNYDYNKMIKDFESKERRENHFKKIKRRWASVGKHYDETIQKMKELKEENFIKQNLALKKKLKEKENKNKIPEKQINILNLIKKEKAARENVQKFLYLQEEGRLRFEEDTIQKSKILY